MSYEYITNRNSPNFWDQNDLAGYQEIEIESFTIHHWGSLATRFWPTVNWVCRPNGDSSAHEVIEAGRVAHLINLYRAAWHSGSLTGNLKSYALELNPRASDGDYNTAAERIADLWHAIKKKVPLRPHNSWTATECPGRYDLARLTREANVWFNRKYGKRDIMATLDQEDLDNIAYAVNAYNRRNESIDASGMLAAIYEKTVGPIPMEDK